MSLTLAVLSWRAHRTLTNTLESYKIFGLDKLADQKIIYFQEMDPRKDVSIANKYGYSYIGSHNNVGIAAAYKRLVENSTGRHFLFLENDWVLIDTPDEQIYKGRKILDRGYADVIRYRHRKYPGHPLWTLQFQGCELDHPTHILDALHWHEKPDSFKGISKGFEDFYYANATNANWTNNPTMFRTDWLKDNVVPRIGNRDVEVDMQQWWEHQYQIHVAQSDGLFTHRRIG